MGKFIAKLIVSGEAWTEEVSHDEVYDKALSMHGGGYTPKQTADAMMWVEKVKQATSEKPVTVSKKPNIYIGLYYKEDV